MHRIWAENAEGCEFGIRLKVTIGGFDGDPLSPAQTVGLALSIDNQTDVVQQAGQLFLVFLTFKFMHFP